MSTKIHEVRANSAGHVHLFRTNAAGKLNAVPLEQWAAEVNAKNALTPPKK